MAVVWLVGRQLGGLLMVVFVSKTYKNCSKHANISGASGKNKLTWSGAAEGFRHGIIHSYWSEQLVTRLKSETYFPQNIVHSESEC